MFLHHYFNKEKIPFRSISELPEHEAKKIWYSMASYLTRRDGGEFNPSDYDGMIANRYSKRRQLEETLRQQFIKKGGNVSRNYPYYLILSKDEQPDNGLLNFYENGDFITIPVQDFDMSTVSFSYGDSYAQYYGSEFEKDKFELVYTYDEILDVVEKHGWVKKNENGWGFVEAQLWSDTQINDLKLRML